MQQRSFRIILAVVGLLTVMSVVILIVGVVKYQQNKDGANCDHTSTGKVGKPSERHKLVDFLTKVKKRYFKLYPNDIALDPESEVEDFIHKYIPYDANWMTIKKRTEQALELSDELNNLHIDRTKLRPREKKGLAQVEHYLYSIFGKPYDENYFAGDWMMGPNYFCWQQICSLPMELFRHFSEDAFQPNTLNDVKKLIQVLKQFKQTIETYRSNMKLGIKSGMVRSVEDCKAGLNAFKGKFPKLVDKGAKGILLESFAKHFGEDNYYSKLSSDVEATFKAEYSMTVKERVCQVIEEYFGTPIEEFIHYLEVNHSRYCVPSHIASGLGNLPLEHVWFDQKETEERTTQKLPSGEPLDGRKSYEMILPYFTTTKKYNAASINQLGIIQRDKLYKRAKEIAMNITKTNNLSRALEVFKADLDHPRNFFNVSQIPENENNELGGSRCKNMESAKINCPVRYDAMMRWFKYVQPIIARLDSLTVDMFYMAGKRLTTPSCPVKMMAKFNPSSGSQSYRSSSNCQRPCYYMLPFFIEKPGPKYNAFSVAGHETRPGHHTQVQGFEEHFSTSGNNDVFDWLNSNTYYTAFTEGWALYAENPLLATETDLYKDEPLQEYGMLKWQIWRALRLIIDSGLHARGMTLQESLKMFEEYAWDTSDKAYKDTIRYMSDPGQATAYMIGQLTIWNMRKKTEEAFRKADVKFNEKEFHFQVLSQGSSPLDYLQDYIDDFIECTIDSDSRDDCAEILDPKLAASLPKCEAIGRKERWDSIQYHKDLLRITHD